MNDLSARIETLFYNLTRDNFRTKLYDNFYKQELHHYYNGAMEVEFWPVYESCKSIKTGKHLLCGREFCGQASKNRKSRN